MRTDSAAALPGTVRRIAGLAGVLLLASSCRRAPTATTSAIVAPALPEAPENLLALIVLPHPEPTWQSIRSTAGPTAGELPATLAAAAADLLDLPDAALDELDTGLPVIGAVTQIGEQRAAMLALHVKDGARLVALLTQPGAAFTSHQTPGDPVVELTANTLKWFQLAVVDNYLVAARDLEVVRSAIPFVTQNLATQPVPVEDLVITATHVALGGRLRAAVEHWWTGWRQGAEARDLGTRQAHGASAPDFGDPAEALADIEQRAQHLWDLLSDVREASVRVTLGEAGHLPNLRVEVAMRAQSADGPFAHEVAALSGGDGHELLSLPKNLAAALLVYDDRRAREEGASQRLDALSKVLGGRIDRWDHGKIESAFSGWARGRGDWLTVGMLTDGGRRTGVWRTAVSDRAALQQAVVSILHLVEVPAISAPLADWVGELTLSPPTAGAASTESVHIVRRPPKLRRRPGEAGVNANVFDAVWSVGDATAAGAIGDDARAQLESLTRGGGRTLREQTRLVAALARRAGGTSLCAFVDLGRLGLWHGESPSIVLTYGRPRVDGRDEASLTIDIPPALLLDYTSTLASLLHP